MDKKKQKGDLEKPFASAIDLGWRQLRRLEIELMEGHLVPYAEQLPSEVMQEALHECLPPDLVAALNRSLLMSPFFWPWFIFHWVSGKDLGIKGLSSGEPLALHYSRTQGEKLSILEKRFIETHCKTHYSFYEIAKLMPEQSLIVKDILLDTEHQIKECQSRYGLKERDIVFGKILTLDGLSIFVGLFPYVIERQHYVCELIIFRNTLTEKNAGQPLTVQSLREEYAIFVMDEFRSIMIDTFYVSRPQLRTSRPLKNPRLYTSPIVLYRSYFRLAIGSEEAVKRLSILALCNDPERMLYDLKQDPLWQEGQLAFPWLIHNFDKKRTCKVMGSISVEGSRLILVTHAESIAQRGQALLKDILGDQLLFDTMVIEARGVTLP